MIKTCQTNYDRVIHAFFSPTGQRIITTSTDDNVSFIVDILDTECALLHSITDPENGIHLGIFGENDYEVIINSKKNNNLSKRLLLPSNKLLNPESLKLSIYTNFVLNYMNNLGERKASFDDFIAFISEKNGNESKDSERIIFDGLDTITQNYLRALISGRPEPANL